MDGVGESGRVRGGGSTVEDLWGGGGGRGKSEWCADEAEGVWK